MRCIVFILLVLSSIVGQVFGQDDLQNAIITDRPDQTESPFIVPIKSLQIETGFCFESDMDRDILYNNFTYNALLLRFGVTNHLEVRLASNYLSERELDHGEILVKEQTGFSPTSIGVKIKISEAKGDLPEMAFLTHLTLMNGDRSFRPTFVAPDLRFVVQHAVSEKLSPSYNLGAEWKSPDIKMIGLYTISTGYAISEKLNAFMECYGYFTKEPDHRIDAGITYLFSNIFQIDVSSGFGLFDHSPDYFVSTGLSIRL